MVLDECHINCSLKCSALAYALENMDPSYEVIAFIDADAKPHSTWLRELVAPLSDPAIGVSTGNRWYLPVNASLGSLVRYFWNAGAIVQVWYNGLAWGGSMALRRATIDKLGIIAAMRKSFVDDGVVVLQTKAAGLRAQFVPTVIVPNREDISIASFAPWSARQLVAARSSGSGWFMVLFHAYSIGVCVFVPPVLLLIGFAFENRNLLNLGIVLITLYWIVVVLSTLGIEAGMQRVFQRNGVTASWLGIRAVLYYFPAAVLSHLVYFIALIDASFRRKLSWRGIEYSVSSEDKVSMVQYRPYVEGRCESKSLV